MVIMTTLLLESFLSENKQYNELDWRLQWFQKTSAGINPWSVQNMNTLQSLETATAQVLYRIIYYTA